MNQNVNDVLIKIVSEEIVLSSSSKIKVANYEQKDEEIIQMVKDFDNDQINDEIILVEVEKNSD